MKEMMERIDERNDENIARSVSFELLIYEFELKQISRICNVSC